MKNGQDDVSYLKTRIEKNSGIVSSNVDYLVTHVISTPDEVKKTVVNSDKLFNSSKMAMLPGLRAAVARNIPIVPESFVDEAIRSGRLPQVSGYKFHFD